MIVVTSMYADPIHTGHIDLLREAKGLTLSNEATYLIVIVNNDEQSIQKKGFIFMPCKERLKVVKSIRYVDAVFESIDKDKTVCESLILLQDLHQNRIKVFCKGGDSVPENVPEMEVCNQLGILVKFGIGGEKVQSSSQLVKRGRENSNKNRI